jgi:hypothetical protein
MVVAMNTVPRMSFPDDRVAKLLLPQRDEQFALSAKMVNNRVCVPYLYKSEADYLGNAPDPYPEDFN